MAEGRGIDMINEEKLIVEIQKRNVVFTEEQLDLLEYLIESQPKLDADTNVGSKWIPCSERLPDTKTKPYQFVLLQVGNSIVVGYVNSAGQWFVDTGDGWSANLDGEPVAWQPLPEPYKGE